MDTLAAQLSWRRVVSVAFWHVVLARRCLRLPVEHPQILVREVIWLRVGLLKPESEFQSILERLVLRGVLVSVLQVPQVVAALEAARIRSLVTD